MSRPRFLIDENLARRAIMDEVRRHNPAIDILHVGDQDAPPIGTLDPEVLTYCEQMQRMLVTDNRVSMPGHVADFFQAGHRHWGILKVRKGRKSDLGGIIESLVLIWELEEAEDYLDRELWIPFYTKVRAGRLANRDGLAVETAPRGRAATKSASYHSPWGGEHVSPPVWL